MPLSEVPEPPAYLLLVAGLALASTSALVRVKIAPNSAPTFGSINYTSVLADYRRYFMPAAFYTLATRVMHYGRYGAGGEDSRLIPLFMGYPEFVRGYDRENFYYYSCGALGTVTTVVSFAVMGGTLLLIRLLKRQPPVRA